MNNLREFIKKMPLGKYFSLHVKKDASKDLTKDYKDYQLYKESYQVVRMVDRDNMKAFKDTTTETLSNRKGWGHWAEDAKNKIFVHNTKGFEYLGYKLTDNAKNKARVCYYLIDSKGTIKKYSKKELIEMGALKENNASYNGYLLARFEDIISINNVKFQEAE